MCEVKRYRVHFEQEFERIWSNLIFTNNQFYKLTLLYKRGRNDRQAPSILTSAYFSHVPALVKRFSG